MTVARIELQVAERLAAGFVLDAFHYGLIVQVRRHDGERIREVVTFHALASPNAGEPDVPGVGRDRQRVEFERGMGTTLDRRLVRRSAFVVDIDALSDAADGSLQRVFLVLRPAAGGVSAQMGLQLLIDQCAPADRDDSLLQLLWAADEWRDDDAVFETPYAEDMAGYVAAIADSANRRADNEDAAGDATPTAVPVPPATCGQVLPQSAAPVRQNPETIDGTPALSALVREIERNLSARLATIDERLARLERTPAPARAPPRAAGSATALNGLLTQIQRAADAALAGGHVQDIATLTHLTTRGLPEKTADIVRSHSLRIGAHSALNDLGIGFADVEFLSVSRPDGSGWLLPSNRANYNHTLSRYFRGDPQEWPRFVEPATCRIDSAGRAIVTRKGSL